MIARRPRGAQSQLPASLASTVLQIRNCNLYSCADLLLPPRCARSYHGAVNDSYTRRLAPGDCLRLRDAAGRTIQCCAGSVWITQENDPRDKFLLPGQRFTLNRPGVALVSAGEGMRDEWLRDTGITVICVWE
jgi:hypothetical protein